MVETDGLENRYALTGIEGSNPSASAGNEQSTMDCFYLLALLSSISGRILTFRVGGLVRHTWWTNCSDDVEGVNPKTLIYWLHCDG